MARVAATRYVRVGGRRLPTKAVRGFMQMVPGAVMEASATQFRVMAEESRELIIDKLMAATPQAPASARVRRPPLLRRPDILPVDRRPFNHEQLDEGYVRQKAREELDGRKLLATGDYIDGIEARRFEIPGIGVVWGVGVENRRHEPSGLPLDVVGGIHERGSATANIPPRPHWRPALRIVRRQMARAGRAAQAEGLRRAIREAR